MFPDQAHSCSTIECLQRRLTKQKHPCFPWSCKGTDWTRWPSNPDQCIPSLLPFSFKISLSGFFRPLGHLSLQQCLGKCVTTELQPGRQYVQVGCPRACWWGQGWPHLDQRVLDVVWSQLFDGLEVTLFSFSAPLGLEEWAGCLVMVSSSSLESNPVAVIVAGGLISRCRGSSRPP